MRDDELPVSDSSRIYLRDTTDHAMQVVDVNESYRELATSLIDVYLSLTGQRTNEIMRVLTVVASVFIPLTFLAGVYGMNFDTTEPMNMPELGWRFGYLYFLGLCVVVASVLLYLFRRIGWLAPVRIVSRGTAGRE
jgi:magnesium transporter